MAKYGTIEMHIDCNISICQRYLYICGVFWFIQLNNEIDTK